MDSASLRSVIQGIPPPSFPPPLSTGSSISPSTIFSSSSSIWLFLIFRLPFLPNPKLISWVINRRSSALQSPSHILAINSCLFAPLPCKQRLCWNLPHHHHHHRPLFSTHLTWNSFMLHFCLALNNLFPKTTPTNTQETPRAHTPLISLSTPSSLYSLFSRGVPSPPSQDMEALVNFTDNVDDVTLPPCY